jgi:hypothetical protein
MVIPGLLLCLVSLMMNSKNLFVTVFFSGVRLGGRIDFGF